MMLRRTLPVLALTLSLLAALAACAPLPRLSWGAAATGPTPPLLPTSALPSGAVAPDPGTGLAAQAAALQGQADALRAK